MTTTDDQYVPTEEDMEERYVRHSLALVDFPRGDRPEWEQKLREEFCRGLARVRRDAAREALDGLARQEEEAFLHLHVNDAPIGAAAAQYARSAAEAYKHEHYPEETP